MDFTLSVEVTIPDPDNRPACCRCARVIRNQLLHYHDGYETCERCLAQLIASEYLDPRE